jgi:hypothetical protein
MEAVMSDALGEDLILGGKALAQFLFKDDSEKKRRKVYHMNERGLLPLFKVGPELAGRKSTLLRHIERGEREGAIKSS